ncbi:hypothetical protein [Nocardia sp. NPDC052566]|uniref:MmyB family transcriptional regulator n=1 Tax=Nocardia sp. NPDC052566 TaxID=3364330 RepID=UPI0037C8E74B
MAGDVSKRLGLYMRERRKTAGWDSLDRLAEKMEEIRKLKEKSQPHMGWDEVTVGASNLAKQESGLRWPTPKMLALWFEAVGISYYYRDQIRKLMSPELWQLDWGELPTMPSADNMKVLRSYGTPAAYLSEPMWNLLGANDQFLEMFPGLDVGMNVAEWMLSSDWARLRIHNWRLRTHILIAAVANIGRGIVPDEELQKFIDNCSEYPEFDHFWTTDPPEHLVLNTDLIMRMPDKTYRRYISGTTHLYHPPTLFSGYSLTYDPEFEFAA